MFPPDEILTEVIFILLQLFILLFTYRILDRKLFQPGVLFSLVWFVIMLLRFLFKVTILDELEPISLETYLIFFIGTVFFSLGSVIMDLSLKKTVGDRRTASLPEDVSLTIRAAAIAVIVIGLPFYVRAAIKIFLASQIEDFFVGLRYELSYGDADIGPVKYFMPLSYVVFSLNLYAYYRKKSAINIALLVITVLVTVTYAVLATGRTFFFMILVIYFGISYLAKVKFTFKKYVIAFSAFFIIFILFGIILGKGGNTDNTIKDNLNASAQFLGIYLVSPLNAFDIELKQHTESSYGGNNSGRFFLKTAMGLNLIPNKTISDPSAQEFVFVPYPTNTYTFYNFYVLDFGRLYAWFMLGVFGALHTWLYHRALYLKSTRFMLYYTFLLFPLMLSFFSDLYLSLFSLWLQLVFFTEFLLFANRIFLRKKLPAKLQSQ